MLPKVFLFCFAILCKQIWGATWMDANEYLHTQGMGIATRNHDLPPSPRGLIGNSPFVGLKLKDSASTLIGTKIKKYIETFNGIRITNTILSLENDIENDVFTGQASGNLVHFVPEENSLIQTLTANLTKDEILLIVRSIHPLGVVNIVEWQSEKVIFIQGNKPLLVYEVTVVFQANSKTHRNHFIVEAKSLSVLSHWSDTRNFAFDKISGKSTMENLENVYKVKQKKELQDYYKVTTLVKAKGGNEIRGELAYGKTMPFLLVTQLGNQTCSLANDKIAVYNLDHQISMTNTIDPFAFDCLQNINDDINGGYSPLTDAYFFANKVFELFDKYVFIEPIESKPFKILVHYGNDQVVAQYMGSFAQFGDGLNHVIPPLVTCDVIAHELGHGFTEFHSGLYYVNQSGAIDESYADLVGEATELFVFGKNDFVLGSDLGIENMNRWPCHPKSDGHSIDHVKDYHDNMDVHQSSGVYNKVWCLIAKKIGLLETFKLFSHANRFYWYPIVDFVQGACGVMKAAYDLGIDLVVVQQSFMDVGIDVCPIQNFIRTIRGDIVLNNLASELDHVILFKIDARPFSKQKVNIFTIGGTGDVDLYLGLTPVVHDSNYLRESNNRGNIEQIIFFNQGKLITTYLFLKSRSVGFSNVTLTVTITNLF